MNDVHDSATERVPGDDGPSRRFRIIFAALMLVIALGWVWVFRVKTERVVVEPPPVLALAGVSGYISGDSAGAERLLDLLAAELGRVPRLTVLRRVHTAGGEDGPEQLLYAELQDAPPGHLLEVRRVDAESGSLIHRYRVTGASIEEAAYRLSVQVAMNFGLPRPDPRP